MQKAALITGAARRIGSSVAMHLAENGWNLFLHYNTSEEEATQLAVSLKQKYSSQEFVTIRADFSDPGEAEALVPFIVSAYGPFELLVNNAAVFNRGCLTCTSWALLSGQMMVNLFAPFILMRDFAVHCHHGNIINFSDTRISSNKSDFAAYTLSKKGIWELTKMAAIEFGPGIRVNAIAPGVTLPPKDKDAVYLNQLAEKIPMKKPGGVRPVLMSIDFILRNDHLTGQLIFADGGENL